MKKVIKLALVATVLALVVAVSAMAHTVTYDLVEYNASANEYDLVITVACDNDEKTTTFATKLELNTEVVGPLSTEAGYITAGKITVTEGRNQNTYSFSLLDQEWTTEGTTAKLLASCTSADFAKFGSTVEILTIPLKIAEGKTPADILEDDLKVTYVVLGTSVAEYAYNEPTITNPIGSIVNNAVAKPAATLEIDVLAGDTVYEGDKITEVAEAGKYTVTATEGYVIVNSGYTAQKVYEVKSGSVAEVTALADGVVAQDAVGIRSDSEDTTGIRFKSHFTLAAKAQFVEAGVVVGVEKNRTYDKTTLVVGGANTKTGIAYNATTDIYFAADTTKQVVTAVATGIPLNATNVNVKIAVRPYYKLANGTIVYGEIVRKTAYEAAYSIKNAADQSKYEANKAYVDEIIALGESSGQGDTIVDVGTIFGIN